MNEKPAARGFGARLGLLARLAVGAMFIYLGFLKLQDPVAFLKILRIYDLFPQRAYWLMNLTVAALPWMEIACGLLLILGVAVRGTALLMLLLLAGFTFAIYSRAGVLQAEQQISFCSIAFDCGCGTGVVNACGKLTENGALMLACVLSIAVGARRYCLLGRPGA